MIFPTTQTTARNAPNWVMRDVPNYMPLPLQTVNFSLSRGTLSSSTAYVFTASDGALFAGF